MTPFAEEIFLSEILNQCRSSIAALEMVKNSLQNENANKAQGIFEALDDFIDHTSRVSVLIWPTNSNNPRGEHLRRSLNISENHQLEKRRLRNHLQHFDERLDAWAASGVRSYTDRNVGNPSASVSIDGKTPNIMRNFDPETSKYTFKGDEFDIAEMIEGVMDIAEKAKARKIALQEALRQAHRDQRSLPPAKA